MRAPTAYAAPEDLLDEEPGGWIEPVAEGLLGDRQDLLGTVEAELSGKEPDVGLVLPDPVGEDLERQQGGRGGCHATETREVEHRLGLGIIAGEKALTASFNHPAGRPRRAATTAAAS